MSRVEESGQVVGLDLYQIKCLDMGPHRHFTRTDKTCDFHNPDLKLALIAVPTLITSFKGTE